MPKLNSSTDEVGTYDKLVYEETQTVWRSSLVQKCNTTTVM